MCALFGYLDCGKRIPMKTLQKLIQALAVASEVRGNDASGISYLHDDKLTIYKRPKPVHRMTFRLPKDTNAVMGHVRLTTQGKETFNANNHPFMGHADKDFALAHNGVLYNDRELRVTKRLPKTKIETDSYVAVQLIEAQKALNFDTLRSMAEDVQGSFTFTILDETSTLWFVKGNSPLCLLYFPELGLYVYSSTASIMKEALKQTPLRKMHYEVLCIDDGSIVRITPDGTINRESFRMQSVYETRFGYPFGETVRWSYPYGAAEEDESDLMDDENYAYLIDLCSYFNVSKNTLLHLLHIGYTYDEIEEYLYSAAPCTSVYDYFSEI